MFWNPSRYANQIIIIPRWLAIETEWFPSKNTFVSFSGHAATDSITNTRKSWFCKSLPRPRLFIRQNPRSRHVTEISFTLRNFSLLIINSLINKMIILTRIQLNQFCYFEYFIQQLRISNRLHVSYRITIQKRKAFHAFANVAKLNEIPLINCCWLVISYFDFFFILVLFTSLLSVSLVCKQKLQICIVKSQNRNMESHI